MCGYSNPALTIPLAKMPMTRIILDCGLLFLPHETEIRGRRDAELFSRRPAPALAAFLGMFCVRRFPRHMLARRRFRFVAVRRGRLR